MRSGCIVLALLALMVQGMGGTTWKVGDSKGWQLNVDYAKWTQGKVFEVGDSLLFTYNKSTENVLELSAVDFASCTTLDPIAIYTDGNSSVLLGNYSERYFIGGIPGHCLAGMTLQIHVGTPAPSPSPMLAPSTLPPVPDIQSSPPSASSPSSPPLLSQQGRSPTPTLPSSAPGSLNVICLAALLAICVGAASIL